MSKAIKENLSEAFFPIAGVQLFPGLNAFFLSQPSGQSWIFERFAARA
jgi:hypothetical protein